MGQSLVANYLHIIFSTKYREPLIYQPYEEKLYRHISEVCKSLECPAIILGGYQDHIHILCRLTAKIPLMKLVEKIKTNSSIWMKKQSNELINFYWQDGYAAFSVKYEEIQILKKYIENQHLLHAKKDFKKELISILNQKEANYKEEYLWD